jgi:prepilin-type N-terminal cleavage/methylation domain-containing protein
MISLVNRHPRDCKLRRPEACSEKAFTLLEVLVAMFVLGMSISSLFVLMSRSLSNVERMESVSRALMLGQSKLNELLISHQALDGDSTVKSLEVGNAISGQWDELTRWEASATTASGREAAMTSSVVPVQILFTVYWKRNSGGRENSLLLETTQLWTEISTRAAGTATNTP